MKWVTTSLVPSHGNETSWVMPCSILEARLELKLPHNTASNQCILKSWVLIICIHTDVIQCVDNVTKSKINVHTKNQEWHTKKTGQPIYLSLILNPDPFNQSLWHCPFLSSACAAIPYPSHLVKCHHACSNLELTISKLHGQTTSPGGEIYLYPPLHLILHIVMHHV